MTAAMPPLWLMTATGPSLGSTSTKSVEKHAIAPLPKFARPWLLGPTRRMPAARAVATMRSCTARPSSPVSAKPEAMMIAAFTPSFAHSCTAATVPSPPTITMASSGTSGSDASDG